MVNLRDRLKRLICLVWGHRAQVVLRESFRCPECKETFYKANRDCFCNRCGMHIRIAKSGYWITDRNREEEKRRQTW